MIIDSISMKNFQCYYGEHENNNFKFNKGLNLVIGDNGGGKSKLYDAFYWVLYDQVFHSDRREFVKTKIYQENLLSDKAKNECSIGGNVDVEVILIASTAQDKLYKISRIYSAKKTNDREWECATSSKLIVDEMKSTRWSTVSREKHDSILARVIPNHLKPYMWFQGEQVDGLMDFRDKSTLEKAINLLSNIHVYDDLISITKNGFDKANKSLITAQARLVKDKDKAEKLTASLEKNKKDIGAKKEAIEKNREDYEIAKDKIDELIGQIEDAKQKESLKAENNELQLKLDEENKQLKNIYNSLHKKMFSDFWILKNSQKHFDKFADKYTRYISTHNKLTAAENHKDVLPVNVPQPVYVEQMLDVEKCLVCGRDAKNGTDEYNHIKKLLERGTKKTDVSIFKNDCSSIFSKLYNDCLGFKQLIISTNERIENEFNKIEELKNNIIKYNKRKKEISDNFEDLIDDNKSNNIVNSFRTHEMNRDKYQSLVTSGEADLIRLEKNQSGYENEFAKLVKGEVKSELELANTIFNNLHEIAKCTRNEVFNKLIEELEENANDLFGTMTEKNMSITGKIKLKKISNGHYIPEIVDKNGHILPSPNDSNIILVKLALIMSIINSRGKWSENYSLILDAPTSKMAEKYTLGFYETLGKTFKQSIVTTYDFIDSDLNNLKEQFNLGSVYIIKSLYPNGDRTDRTDLSIEINKVEL